MAHGLSDKKFTSYKDSQNCIESWVVSKDIQFFRRGIWQLSEKKVEKVVASSILNIAILHFNFIWIVVFQYKCYELMETSNIILTSKLAVFRKLIFSFKYLLSKHNNFLYYLSSEILQIIIIRSFMAFIHEGCFCFLIPVIKYPLSSCCPPQLSKNSNHPLQSLPAHSDASINPAADK